KQKNFPVLRLMLSDGVRSLWNGQEPVSCRPTRLTGTRSATSEATSIEARTCAARSDGSGSLIGYSLGEAHRIVTSSRLRVPLLSSPRAILGAQRVERGRAHVESRRESVERLPAGRRWSG